LLSVFMGMHTRRGVEDPASSILQFDSFRFQLKINRMFRIQYNPSSLTLPFNPLNYANLVKTKNYDANVL
jgi:hypothetical protein